MTPLPFEERAGESFAVDEGWGLDLEAHRRIFPDLHIIAPSSQFDRSRRTLLFSKNAVTFHRFPQSSNFPQSMLAIPKLIWTLHRFTRREDLIHSAGTAYPPFGLVAHLYCWITGRERRVFVLDADFVEDMIVLGRSTNGVVRRFAIAMVRIFYDRLFRFCIARSSITFVVGNGLFHRYRGCGNVVKIRASWVKREEIIPHPEFEAKVHSLKRRATLRLVFMAGLIPKKGPTIAVDAVRISLARSVRISLDIYGDGPMRGQIEERIATSRLGNSIELKGTVPYDMIGQILRGYDAILITNLSGEQPRVLFDAMANGVAVICPRSQSYSDLVFNLANGILCEQGNPESFADGIQTIYNDRDCLQRMISEGLLTAKDNTIESMHERRSRDIINTFFGSRSNEHHD